MKPEQVKHPEEIEQYINESTLGELEYVMARYGGPNNYLLRGKLGIREDLLKAMEKAIAVRQLEDVLLG